MKEGTTRYTPGIRRTLLGALALFVLTAFAAPQAALADTAANTLITNTVTVNYDDALGNAQTEVTDFATITVSLVEVAPTISSPADRTITEGEATILSYTITGQANGEDIYDLSTASADAGISAPSITINGGTAEVTLGGTTLAADTVAGNTITVPYDNNADGDSTSTNGITGGDTIVIDGTEYVVAAGGVSEDSATNLTTITLTSNVAGGVTAGSVVGERQTFSVEVTSGNLSAAPASGTHTVDTTATSRSDNTVSATQATSTVITVTIAQLSVTKEVSTDGTSFAASANASPGDTLTYRITVTNSGSGDATNVVITDPEPQFTTYVGGSAEYGTTTDAAYGDAGNTSLSDIDTDGDGYDFGNTTAGEATYSAGDIAPGNSVVLFFQVGVN